MIKATIEVRIKEGSVLLLEEIELPKIPQIGEEIVIKGSSSIVNKISLIKDKVWIFSTKLSKVNC